MSLVKNWVEESQNSKIKLANKNESKEVKLRFIASFLQNGTPCFSDHFSNVIFSKYFKDNSRKLFDQLYIEMDKLGLNKDITLYLLEEYDPYVIKFNFEDLVAVLEEVIFSEFHLFDETFSWVFCVNHHDYLIKAIAKNKQEDTKSKSFNGKNKIKKFTYKQLVGRLSNGKNIQIIKEDKEVGKESVTYIEFGRVDILKGSKYKDETYVLTIEKSAANIPRDCATEVDLRLEFNHVEEIIEYLVKKGYIMKDELLID